MVFHLSDEQRTLESVMAEDSAIVSVDMEFTAHSASLTSSTLI